VWEKIMTQDELKAEFAKLHERIDTTVTTVKSSPPWKLYLGGAVLLLIIIYLGWMIWDIKRPSPKAGDIAISVPEAKVIQNMQRERIITNTYYIKDKEAAVRDLGLPASESSNPKEQLLTASAVAANRYGATTAVFVNISTGRPRTDIKYKESPIFAFKRDMAYGIGAGIGTQGQALAGRIRLDALQIKGVTVSPEIELNYADRRDKQVEGRFLIWAEYRP
jgi:hypothetical protein